jgi:hypothetical protein
LILSDENLTETEITLSGKILAEGFPVTIDQAPGSVTIFYRTLPS